VQKLNKSPLLQNYLKSKPIINKKNDHDNNDDSDSMNSADCDEKRSYTPEPRHMDALQ